MAAIRKIDSANSAYQLRQALAEQTNGNVSTFTMSPVQQLEDGIKKRQLTATIDGERKRFVAVEQQGKVGIYDGTFDLQPNQVHAFLTKFDEARAQAASQSATATNTDKEASQSNATTKGTRSTKGTTTGQTTALTQPHAQTTQAPTNANGWPMRATTKAKATANGQSQARRR